MSFNKTENNMLEKLLYDKTKKPADKDLSEVLGSSYKNWEEIKKFLNEEFGSVVEDWKFYGQKYGWALKMLLKKRNLFFFVPGNNKFKIAFIFGDKAVSVVEKTDLPKELIEELKNAKKYMEGRGLSIEMKSKKQVDIIKKLVRIKVEN